MSDIYLSPPDASYPCVTDPPCGYCGQCQRTAALYRRLRRAEEAAEGDLSPLESEPQYPVKMP
jgi:hypothetical protein